MIRQILQKERGQSVVEMALVATLLLSLVGGVVDFGSAFHHYIIITNAAREGARYAATDSRLASVSTQSAAIADTRQRVQTVASSATGITLADAEIQI